VCSRHKRRRVLTLLRNGATVSPNSRSTCPALWEVRMSLDRVFGSIQNKSLVYPTFPFFHEALECSEREAA
jgi:hypothetical protein